MSDGYRALVVDKQEDGVGAEIRTLTEAASWSTSTSRVNRKGRR